MLTDKIRRLLSANRLEEAFDLLLAITKVRDAKTHDQLVLLLSSHNANTIRSQLGTINFEQARIEQNKIVSALLRILGRVEQSEYTSGLEEAVLLKKWMTRTNPKKKFFL